MTGGPPNMGSIRGFCLQFVNGDLPRKSRLAPPRLPWPPALLRRCGGAAGAAVVSRPFVSPAVPVGWRGCPRCPRPTSPAHRNGGTSPGNQSNSPPQPSPKKENTGEACGDPLPPLPLLPAGAAAALGGRLLLRSCGGSLPPLPC